MKKFLGLLIALIFSALMFAGPAMAVDQIFCKFMIGTDAKAAMLIADDEEVTDDSGYNIGAYVVIPGDNNAQVVVTSISGTADGTASTNNMIVFDKLRSVAVNSQCNAGSAVIGIASPSDDMNTNNLLVIQDAGGNTIYIESVASVGSNTIGLASQLDGQIESGWTVYEMEQIGQIPVGNATISYESDVAVVAGQKNSPLLIYLGGAAACSINFASGHYR